MSAVTIGLGCSADVTEGMTPTSASGDETTTGQSSATAETSSGPGESGSESDDGVVLDVGPPTTDGELGCGKVDFLFVIDNSVSMTGSQDNLISSFPGFIDSIQNTLEATSDYHIMVADTDAETRCTPTGCMDDFWAMCLCPGAENGDACNATPDTCDITRGAGVVHPLGANASNEECDIAGGNRYIVEGQPDLLQTFQCMAQVGEAGHPAERPMDAMVEAVSDALNGPGGCNEGFLRDDAILVVTFISDDENYEDSGSPQAWYDAVVAAKGGNANAIVMLGLVPEYGVCESSFANCGVGAPPEGTPASGKHWVELVDMFGDHGLWAHVCEPDYAPFFDQAVQIIDQTCDGFEG